MKKILAIIAIVTLTLNVSFSQTLSFDNIAKVYVKSTGYILSGKEVSGYYTLYKLENKDKKNALFQLVITDANLNKVVEKEIIDLKTNFIMDAAFNGEALAIKFLTSFREKEGTETVRVYDMTGKEIRKDTKSFDSKAYFLLGILGGGNDDEIENVELQGIPNMGFLNFTPIMTKGGDGRYAKLGDRAGINITMIPKGSAGAKSWSYKSPANKIEIPAYLGTNGEASFVMLTKRDKMTDKTFDFSLMSLDNKTGKINFDKVYTDAKYALNINSYTYLEETKENLFFGTLLEKDTKITKAESEGIFVAKIDNTGNLVSKQNILWSEFAKQFKPVDEKGKPVDIGNVFIHKVISTNDGKIFAIGERFRKAASGAGIAMAILGGGPSGTSVVKAVLEEIVVIEFNKDFKPQKINFYPKGSTSVQMPSYIGLMGDAFYGIYLKATGEFQYSYTQEKDDKSSFTVGYFFRESKTNYFGGISYAEGKFTKDKISLKTESTTLRVFPAKPGYIMINEYFKKLKKMENRLEKFNF